MGAHQNPAADIDPIERHITLHNDAISRHQREIIDLEQRRDVAVRSLESELAEATRSFEAMRDQIARQISVTKLTADGRIETRRRLVASSQAALVALEPNEATRDAPMELRQVPRREPVKVPIHVHKDIRS